MSNRLHLLSIILILLIALSPAHARSEQACEPAAGQEYFSISNFDLAYEKLKNCETVHGLSGDTYGRLAYLVTLGHGAYPGKQARAAAAVRLFVESAAYGSEHGMNASISAFEENNEFVNFEDQVVANCLRTLENAHGEPRRRGVYSCVPARFRNEVR